MTPSSATGLEAAGVKLTDYELQVLIGTSISGCAMNPSETFDLPAAWRHLCELELIDRTDGLAIATPKGAAAIRACMSVLSISDGEGAVTGPDDTGATDAERVLAVLPRDEFHTASISQPEGMPRKDFFNTLSYLVRRGDLERLGYGKYRFAVTHPAPVAAQPADDVQALLETLDGGVQATGGQSEDGTELFHVEDASEAMVDAARLIRKLLASSPTPPTAPAVPAGLTEIIDGLREDYKTVRVWSGSALVANELPERETREGLTQLYSDLCRLGNALEYYADALSALPAQPTSSDGEPT